MPDALFGAFGAAKKGRFSAGMLSRAPEQIGAVAIQSTDGWVFGGWPRRNGPADAQKNECFSLTSTYHSLSLGAIDQVLSTNGGGPLGQRSR